MDKTGLPELDTLDLAELETVSGGTDWLNWVSLEGGITNREFIENNFGVKWPIKD
jgi:hypothetical protein